MVQEERRYIVSSKVILSTSKIFQKGKTQVPVEVRSKLGLYDGDTVVWVFERNRVYVESANIEYVDVIE